MPDYIDGHKVISFLDDGGFGAVYIAQDRNTNETIAIKTLLSDLSGDPYIKQLFEREYHILDQMRIPGVVPVHMMGFDPVYGLYFTMPYLDSGTLEVARQTTSVGILLNWWIDLLHILAHAHRCGLVHRDIKPRNIVIDHSEVIVVDWGLGRAEGTKPHFTGKKGTPGWSPQELLDDGDAGAYTDTYALVGLLAWMLTGYAPWEVVGREAYLLKDAGYEHPGLAALVQRGLSQRSDRFQNIQELASQASEPLVWVKRHLLEHVTTAEEAKDVFWSRLMQTNTNSLQPKSLNIDFYRNFPHACRQLSYLQLTREQQATIDCYLRLGVRLASEQGIPDSDRHLWRIQTAKDSMQEHQWIFGQRNTDRYRVIRQLDSLAPDDLRTVYEFLMLVEPMSLDLI